MDRNHPGPVWGGSCGIAHGGVDDAALVDGPQFRPMSAKGIAVSTPDKD